MPPVGRGGPGQQRVWPAPQRDYRRNLCAGQAALPDCIRLGPKLGEALPAAGCQGRAPSQCPSTRLDTMVVHGW